VPVCDGLVPGHVSSRLATQEAAAWVIDAFGTPHPLASGRTVVGRRPEADLVVLNSSVSRDHAELHRTEAGWQVRDLGSRNGTVLDGRRVQGRATLLDRSQLKFGEVTFLFVGRPVAMPDRSARSVDTHHAGRGPFRFNVRGAELELCVVGSEGEDSEAAGGALLHRASRGGAWSELSLAPLEFQMIRLLCVRAVDDEGSPSRARGCVPTKQLAKKLPFQSRYANEENVRQVVRRLRATLAEIGADDLLVALPGRGYYLAWPVAAG
jgi:hypothetical protein